MTDFDLGDPAPDADDEPDDEPDSSEDTTADPEPDTEPTDSESEYFENVGPDPSEVDMSDDGSGDEDEPEDEPPDPTETGPAFPYSEVKQSPLYAREETWRDFNLAIDKELVPNLRDEEIMDDELREIHDIVLEVAIDHLDEFPERLKEKRRQS